MSTIPGIKYRSFTVELQEPYNNIVDASSIDKVLEDILKEEVDYFPLHTGKGGYINYECSIYKLLGKSDIEVEEYRRRLVQNVPNGIYRIDKNGATKID